MTKIEALLERLPDAQRREVEAYAEKLFESAMEVNRASAIAEKPNNIQFDKLEGMLRDDHSNDDARTIAEAWADAAED